MGRDKRKRASPTGRGDPGPGRHVSLPTLKQASRLDPAEHTVRHLINQAELSPSNHTDRLVDSTCPVTTRRM